MRYEPNVRSREDRQPSAETREELDTCYVEGCESPAPWRHASVWGPHYCTEHVDRVPSRLEYLFRHRETGELLEEL